MAQNPVEVKKPQAPRSVAPDPWQALRSEMDRLFDRFSGGFPALRRVFDPEFSARQDGSLGFAAPAVDVTEDEKAYKIAAELPGMSEKDIDVSINGDILMLTGEKRREREEKDENRYLAERTYGAFQRSFTLPDGVDRDAITAEFSKGVLTLTLPKSPQAQQQRKKIEVKGT